MSTDVRDQLAKPDQEEQIVDSGYDGYYSLLTSFAVHTFFIVLLSLLGSLMFQDRGRPSGVSVVVVGNSDGMGPGGSGGGGGTEGLGTSGEAAGEITPEASVESTATPIEVAPLEDVADATDVEIAPPTEFSRTKANENARQNIADARRQAASAREAVSRALAGNLNGKGGGGGAGSAGKGGGSGGGEGGGIGSGVGSGRAGRATRWVLRFKTNNPRHYLDQMGGLKADIGFPQRDGKYRIFTYLGDNPQSSVRDLGAESRIYWIDDDPNSFLPVAKELGVDSTALMVAFLPNELEQKMLKLELSYKGAKSEDEIVQTVFECISRGGEFDIIVSSQRLRGE